MKRLAFEEYGKWALESEKEKGKKDK